MWVIRRRWEGKSICLGSVTAGHKVPASLIEVNKFRA